MITFYNRFILKVLLLVWLGPLLALSAAAQSPYGNEWINYAQTYYKIKITKTGIYRLDQAYLNNAGLGTANPQNLQLWRRGQEVAVHVAGGADRILNPGDFLEFYGERNDGQLDREMYKKPQDHANPYFSLYTDTAAYFLTVAPVAGKRVSELNLPPDGLPPEQWHKAERLKLYTAEYQSGTYYSDNLMSWGDSSEGYGDVWFGTIGSGVRARIKDFEVDSLLQVEPNGPAPEMEILLEGVLRDAHDVNIALVTPSGAVRDLENNIIFSPWDKIKKTYTLQPADISAAGKVRIRITVNAKGVADIVRVRYLRVRYARKNIFPLRSVVATPADTLKSSPTYFSWQKNNTQNLLAYNVTNPYAIEKIAVNNQANEAFLVAPASNSRKQNLLIVNAGNIYVPPVPEKTTFRNVAGSAANFIFIYHRRLAQPTTGYTNPVKAYAEFRASNAGGQYDTLSFEIRQVYDQFHYGEKSPLAVRHFMQYFSAPAVVKR